MTAHNIIRLPARDAAAIFVREIPGDGWLVLARDHGWLHGDAASAFTDAQWLSENLSLPLRESAAGLTKALERARDIRLIGREDT